MNLLGKNNALTIGLAVIVLLGVGYLAFFANQDDASSDPTPDGPVSPAEFRFIALQAELNEITLPTTILSDERFLALIDLETPIEPEDKGREDPFAPLP